MKVRGFPMSLPSPPEASPGLRDHLADIGCVLPPYGPDVRATPIEAPKGKRLRVGGARLVRLAEHSGTQGVRLPVNQAREALDQGVPPKVDPVPYAR